MKWTIDLQDWRRPGADVIAEHFLTHVQPGWIVLSHDGGGNRSQTIAAYQMVLPGLANQGYVFRIIFTPWMDGPNTVTDKCGFRETVALQT